MVKVQTRKGRNGVTYRVQFMRDGKRVSKSFPTKKEAQKFAAMITVDDELAQHLTNTTLNSFLLSDAISEFLGQYQGKDESLYQRLNYWGQCFANRPVGRITRIDVRSELRNLAKTCKPATVNRYKAALGTIYRYLLNEYDIEHNPTRGIPLIPENNARTRFLSDDELPRLLEACRCSKWDKMYLLVLMALSTGARRGELIQRRWEDVDFIRRTIYLGETKNGEQRTLAITGEVLEELMKFRKGHGYIFPRPSNTEEFFRNFDCYWQVALDKAGIERFKFHDLRHTCASLLAMNGASLIEISQVLGHKSITMTQRYAHLCIEHKQALTERVLGNLSRSRRSYATIEN
ncbi:tyrosine-type recombinase/integrase [Vibrio breoganii]|uniref:tyrosine-type recombinase/integrase n=1 Tax=Vibrio breoganii TaxID=553239 RepID=UPI000C81D88D|nr:site-specific integrase [Vibrio breoganii]PML91994.1 integrase [Vibrio breoganii]PMN63325.1 integrase [Vibrio breoganii]